LLTGTIILNIAGMVVNATIISRLMLRPVMWAHRRIVAGRYGETLYRGGRGEWVRLAAVEAAEGVTFTAAQLEAAGVSICKMEDDLHVAA
jgi:hypothetical protein